MVSLKDLRVSTRKGKAYPRFSDVGTEAELCKARDCFERSLGRRLAEFDEEELRNCFSDAKAADAGISLLGRFYSFRARSLAELLEEREVQALRKAGIESPVALRLKFFEFLSEKHAGFMSSESRDWILREFADQLELGVEKLEEALWLDDDDNKVLARLVETPPENLGAFLNMEILSAILCSSYVLRLGPVAEGSPLKFIFRNLRFYGLLYDAVPLGPGFLFEVDGPLSIFGRPHKFGYRMMVLLYRLRQLSLRREFDCALSIEFRKGKRKLEFESTISKMPEIAWPNVGELKLHLFDSKVEAKIYSTFKAMDLGGWKIEREPTPFASGNTVFIPDFCITRDANRIFIEVVGFWMSEYRKRKKTKLEECMKSGLENLLLVVDERIEEEFKSITSYPVFTYSRAGSSYRIPYPEMLRYLEAKFPRKEPRQGGEATAPEASYVKRGKGRYKVYW